MGAKITKTGWSSELGVNSSESSASIAGFDSGLLTIDYSSLPLITAFFH
jgi:hypothetical protein